MPSSRVRAPFSPLAMAEVAGRGRGQPPPRGRGTSRGRGRGSGSGGRHLNVLWSKLAMEVPLCREIQFMEVEWLLSMNNLSKPRNMLQENRRKEIRVMQ
ncbi:unnamed protein product [Urochloa humidicola]